MIRPDIWQVECAVCRRTFETEAMQAALHVTVIVVPAHHEPEASSQICLGSAKAPQAARRIDPPVP